MLGHGYQMLPEFVPAKITDSIKLELNSTAYFKLEELSNFDSIYGMWFYIEAFTGGAGNLNITFQIAADPNQATWTDIGATETLTGGTFASPIQKVFMRAPLTAAAGSAFATFPPYARFKLVTDVGATAAISKIKRTVRGLA